MILETDFADHWKTQRLVSICGAEAVLCLLRIWSYCQLRKRWKFDDSQASIIEWIGKWNGQEGLLLSTLKEVGFIDEEGGKLSMHDFEDVNGKMVTNWMNGMNATKKAKKRFYQKFPRCKFLRRKNDHFNRRKSTFHGHPTRKPHRPHAYPTPPPRHPHGHPHADSKHTPRRGRRKKERKI